MQEQMNEKLQQEPVVACGIRRDVDVWDSLGRGGVSSKSWWSSDSCKWTLSKLGLRMFERRGERQRMLGIGSAVQCKVAFPKSLL